MYGASRVLCRPERTMLENLHFASSVALARTLEITRKTKSGAVIFRRNRDGHIRIWSSGCSTKKRTAEEHAIANLKKRGWHPDVSSLDILHVKNRCGASVAVQPANLSRTAEVIFDEGFHGIWFFVERHTSQGYQFYTSEHLADLFLQKSF